MERGLEDCHMGCNLEDATFLHPFFVDRSRRNFTFLKDPNFCSFSMMYCCSRINHYAQLQDLSKISCMVMGNCRWAIKRVTVLQIFPSFYLLIHEIPRR